MRPWIANLLVLFVTLALVEVGLQVVPSRWLDSRDYYAREGGSVSYRALFPDVYVLRGPATFRHRTPCTDIPDIAVGDDGFRKVIDSGDGPSVAILGDSFVEALQVGPGESLSDQLGAMVEARVLNRGISAFSTVTEIASYHSLVRELSPEVVVLAFFAGNDVKGNHCRLDPKRRLCGRMVDGAPVLPKPWSQAGGYRNLPQAMEPDQGPPKGFVAKVKALLRSTLVSYHVMHDVKVLVLGTWRSWKGEVLPRYRLYLSEAENPRWKEAWSITRAAFAQLRDQVDRDGAKLVILYVPEHFTQSREWRRELIAGGATAVPDGFDPERPRRLVHEITRDLDIPLVDPTEAMTTYRDRFDLPYPRFAFACDGHWNPLAHRLAAGELARFLVSENWLKPRDGAVPDDRASAPRDLLGSETFEKLYGGGIYRGGAETAVKPRSTPR